MAFAGEMAKDSMAGHDQMMKDCIAKQGSSKTADEARKACQEMLKKQEKAKDTMGKDTMGKDTMGKDTMGKDTMGKDTMGKDAMKDQTAKD
jgi:pentapeptide MXKDX repeat protein